jgi:hypothetical protein
MWVPEWLYRLLPAIYGAAGAACLLSFGWVGPAVFSALALLGAAGLIVYWRLQAAAAQRSRRRRPTRTARALRPMARAGR